MATDKRVPPPTVRLRRLAAELRNLRASAELTREDVTRETGVNAATLYRIEKAYTKPQKRTLMALLDLYKASEEQRDMLLSIQGGSGERGWLRPYHAELFEEYAAYISFEAEARTVRNYESLLVPGLAQTEEYAHAVVRGVLPSARPEDVERRVQVRMERQERLNQGLQLWAIVDEAAVRRTVGGPEIMQAQLRYLLQLMEQPNVTLQVIPFDKGAHVGMSGSFVHMDFPDPGDPEIVYVDTPAGDIFVETEDEIRRYKSMFEYLQAVAVGPEETAELLARVARVNG